jgi:UDP-perosamine 4-acetyltransferase
VRAVIYGSRPDGHARVAVELLSDLAGLELVGLVDDESENAEHVVAGLSVICGGDDLARLRRDGIEAVVLGFGAGRGRCRVIERVIEAGLELPVLVHPAATVASSARLDIGAQVLPGAVIGPGAALGRGVLVNSGAIVEHDCRLDDGAVVYSGAVLAGRVSVGPESEIGAGAVIVPDVHVGRLARVGAGATVVDDVAAGLTVVGVPARPLERS